jgi:RND family efflux transporter MFP subunit
MQGTVILVGVIVVLIYGLVSVPAKAAELATNIAEAVPAPQQQRPAPGTALTLPGNLQAWHDSPIYAHVKGYLKDWYVDFGAVVKAGQLLAEIDTPDLDANLFAAEARLSAARAKVETRQAGLEFAKSTYQRWRDAPTGVVSVQGTLAKQDDFEMATARLLAAMADANVEEREVERLRAHQTSKRITAPFDGVITERNIDIGAPVNDSCGTEERANAALFRIIDLHKIRIFVKVPQEMSGGIKAGLKATLSLPQFPGKVFPAAVVSYSHAIDAKSQTLLVELNADNPDGALQPGSSGQVEFELPSNP